jgi:hypothetical protein
MNLFTEGRIWVLRFYMGKKGKWRVEYALSEPSSPVQPHAKLQIKANKPLPGSDTLQHLCLRMRTSDTLVAVK